MKPKWLTDFLKRLSGERRHHAGNQTGPGPDPEVIKKMVRGIVATRSDELGCDECFEQVDRFADMVLNGRDAVEALPLVQDHLSRCRDCGEEFEALLEALRALS